MKQKRHDIIKNLQEGFYDGINFIPKDEPLNTVVKYRAFFVDTFPTDMDKDCIIDFIGDNPAEYVHRVKRLRYKNKPTTSLLMIWRSQENDPPQEVPLYPDMEEESPMVTFKETQPQKPKCYKCHTLGHIAKHCNPKNISFERQQPTCRRCNKQTPNAWQCP